MFSAEMSPASGLGRMPAGQWQGGRANPFFKYWCGMGSLLPLVATDGTSPSHLGPFNPGLVASGNDTYAHNSNFNTFLSVLLMCDSTDTKGHGPLSVQDKNNGYCLLSTSAFVPGSLLGT